MFTPSELLYGDCFVRCFESSKYVNLNWSIVSLANGNNSMHCVYDCAISMCRKCKAIELISRRLATLLSFNCIRSAPDKRMCLMRNSYAFGEFECSLQSHWIAVVCWTYCTFPNGDTRIKICVNFELINWHDHIQMNIFLDRNALHTHTNTSALHSRLRVISCWSMWCAKCPHKMLSHNKRLQT